MIQFKTIVKDCQFGMQIFSLCGLYSFSKNSHQEVRMMPPERKWDPLRVSLQSNWGHLGRKVPVTTAKTRRKMTAKNWRPASSRTRKTEKRLRKRAEFDKSNLAEASQGPEELARIQEVIKGTATAVFWFRLQAFFWNTFSGTFMYWIMTCILEFRSTDPLLLHCTICQCRRSKLEIKPGSKPAQRRKMYWTDTELPTNSFYFCSLINRKNFVTSKDTNCYNLHLIKTSL